jgi:hypothetical protein
MSIEFIKIAQHFPKGSSMAVRPLFEKVTVLSLAFLRLNNVPSLATAFAPQE